MSQVLAVSCAETQQPEITLITHSLLNRGFCNERNVEVFVICYLLPAHGRTRPCQPLEVLGSLSHFLSRTNRYLKPISAIAWLCRTSGVRPLNKKKTLTYMELTYALAEFGAVGRLSVDFPHGN